jgi:hypothetical protein
MAQGQIEGLRETLEYGPAYERRFRDANVCRVRLLEIQQSPSHYICDQFVVDRLVEGELYGAF